MKPSAGEAKAGLLDECETCESSDLTQLSSDRSPELSAERSPASVESLPYDFTDAFPPVSRVSPLPLVKAASASSFADKRKADVFTNYSHTCAQSRASAPSRRFILLRSREFYGLPTSPGGLPPSENHVKRLSDRLAHKSAMVKDPKCASHRLNYAPNPIVAHRPKNYQPEPVSDILHFLQDRPSIALTTPSTRVCNESLRSFGSL